MMVSQASSIVEHEAVATVLIIGASRGIGLETVKAALEAGHSVRAHWRGQPEEFLLTAPNWKKSPATHSRRPQ